MRQLRKRLLWQVIVTIMALVLIFHSVDGAKDSMKKSKHSKNKKGLNSIQVRVDKPIKPQVDASGIRSFMERSIVPFEYRNINNPRGYPEQIVEVVCSDRCMGNELNAVPIKRNILYLRRDGNMFVLDERVVTVGCTCVYPEIREQFTR